MPQGDVEVIQVEGDWLVRVEGERTVVSRHDTRADAVAAGRDTARHRGVELVVHREDGTIGERDSEGHDPRDVPG